LTRSGREGQTGMSDDQFLQRLDRDFERLRRALEARRAKPADGLTAKPADDLTALAFALTAEPADGLTTRALERSTYRLVRETANVVSSASDDGNAATALRRLDTAIGVLRGATTQNLARMDLIAAIDDAVHTRDVLQTYAGDPGSPEMHVAPRTEYERDLLDELKEIVGFNDFVDSQHYDGGSSGFNSAEWPAEIQRAVDDPAACALGEFASAWPEYAERLTPEELEPAIAVWNQRGRPHAGDESKWRIVAVLIAKTNLGEVSARRLKSTWSDGKPDAVANEVVSDENDPVE